MNDGTDLAKILRLLAVLAVEVAGGRKDIRALDAKVTELDAKVDRLDRRLGRVETRVESTETTLCSFRAEFERRTSRLERAVGL